VTRLVPLLLLLVTGGLVALAAPVPKEHPWVTVRGYVVWPKGQEIPKPAEINVPVGQDRPTCCRDGPLLDDKLIVNEKTRGVKNVVVWLRPDSKDWKETFPKDRVHPALAKPKPVNHVVIMPKCQFSPRVLAARAGDTVEFKNDATIPHNVKFDPPNGLGFNILLKPDGKYTPERALEASVSVASTTDTIHPWMRSYSRVFDHPYFAATDKDGRFELKAVPKGDWRIVYWHETGFHMGADGRFGFPLKVSGTTATLEMKDLSIELPEPK
jgi:plastocyanin